MADDERRAEIEAAMDDMTSPFLPRVNDRVIVKDDPLAEVGLVVDERALGVVLVHFDDGSAITADWTQLRPADVDEDYRRPGGS